MRASTRIPSEPHQTSRRTRVEPWGSFFKADELLALARESGVRETKHVSAAALAGHYFVGRADGLRPPNNSEGLLVASR